jgi:Zn-dependent M16 (insulinase) family peptidase
MHRNDDLASSGHSWAVSLAASSLTSAANSFERLGTLQHDFDLTSQLVKSISTDTIITDVEARLRAIHSYVMNKSKHSICVHTSDAGSSDELGERLGLMYSAMDLADRMPI